MSRTSKALAVQAKNLKATANYSLVVSSLFASGLAGSVVWMASGMPIWAGMAGLVASVTGVAVFGSRVPLAYRKASWIQELLALKSEVAESLNVFPEASEHEAILLTLKRKNVWDNLEHRIALGFVGSDNDLIERMYQTLKRVNGVASMRFVDACVMIDSVKSARELKRLTTQLEEIRVLTERVQALYRTVLLSYVRGVKLDLSVSGVQKFIEKVTNPTSQQIFYTRQIADHLRSKSKLAPNDHLRLVYKIDELEPLIRGFLVGSARRKEAFFEFFLLDLELDAYVDDSILRSLGLVDTPGW